MIELIYYSIASPSLTKADVLTILDISQKNNSDTGITGCMLYYNDAFLQILEGDPEVVESLYSKIEQDRRHYNVKLVFKDNIQQRLFKDWSMGFRDLANDDNDEQNFRESFIAIADQTEQSSVASQLFWDISHQLLSE